MPDQEDVRRIASGLPGVFESDERCAVSVPCKGKANGFVWVWMEREDPKRARVPNPGVVAIMVKNLEVKEMILSSNPDACFTEPHYNGFPAVLVRLDRIEMDELEDLIFEAWKSKATPELVAQLS